MKDYKKILEGVVNIINTTKESDTGFYNICTYIYENCPEINESEDEKIRKDLIEWFKEFPDMIWRGNYKRGHYKKDILAWLEKLGNKGSRVIFPMFTFDDILALQCCMETVKKVQEDKDLYEKLNDLHDRVYDAYHLEKQGKQMNAKLGQSEVIKASKQKFEPKFHIGEWITNGDYNWKIVEVKPLDYILQSQDGNIVDDTISYTDKHFHLWTIQDAKDGDMIVCDINKAEIGGDVEKLPNITPTICIYQNVLKDKDFIHTYCSLYNISSLRLQNAMYYNTFVYNIHPATKEQRDLLFQKMADAGYEWDTENKVLKKIEPKFKVGDWIVKGNVIYRIDKISGVYLTLSTLDGTALVYHISVLDSERIRPWTINDAEEGDVLASGQVVFMFKMIHGVWLNCYCSLHNDGSFIADSYDLMNNKYFSEVYPATKEQRDLLFQKMKEAGYKWDADKKELKTIPKAAPVCNKFDVNTLKPFDKVLVRHNDFCKWRCTFFSHVDPSLGSSICCVDSRYVQCIPFSSETEHLLGTSKKCDPFYEYWKESPNI